MVKKIKIVSVVGTRPQFIKAAIMSRALFENDYLDEKIEEICVNTGQHYDDELSDVFFRELKIRHPKFELPPQKGKSIEQLSFLIKKIHSILTDENPAGIILYGDTNSTLAAAISANSLNIPIVHIEAGERVYRRDQVPEESNRIIVDNLASLCLTSTQKASFYLEQEGFAKERVHFMGDPMFELFKWTQKIIKTTTSVAKNDYHLCTIHRAENTNKQRITEIFQALSKSNQQIILPAHPRLRNTINENNIKYTDNIKIINPLGYFEFQKVLMGANKVITDSGGVTREAFFAKKPSLIPMKNSWWQEIEDSGWARCFENIDGHFIDHLNSSIKPTTYPENLFGSGDISKKGWNKILNYFNENVISKTEAWHPYGSITNLANKKTNDFSYDSYKEILNNFKNKKYKFQKFGDYKKVKKNNPNIFLRHDIDITLDKVIQIARIETEIGVHSTFFFMTNSPFYNIYSSKGHELIEELIQLGHHIGLHFHAESYKNLFLEQDINMAVKKEIKNMENIFDLKIDAVSFHRPNKLLLNGSSLLTTPFPHTYMKEFTKEIDYCSDSSGEWKFGSPLERKSFKSNQDIHLLTHPIWWNETITNPFLVLEKFIIENKNYIEVELKNNSSVFQIKT